jgi:hypothetical protein
VAKGLTGNGTRMFLSAQSGVLTSLETDGLSWTPMPGSPGHGDGCYLSYDAGHRLLYASWMQDSGLWRAVVPK